MTDQTNLHIKTCTETIKRVTKGRKFTVIYSGYDLGISAGKLFNRVLCGNWQVMQMPSVDIICTADHLRSAASRRLDGTAIQCNGRFRRNGGQDTLAGG